MLGELVHLPLALENPAEFGLLYCDGSYYLHTNPDYSGLFGFIGYSFGQGGVYPNYQFRVPDYRDYFLRPCADGRDFDDIQDSQNLEHSHSGTTGDNNRDHTHNIPVRGSGVGMGVQFYSGNFVGGFSTLGQSQTHNHSFTTGNSGGSESRPKNKPVFVYIRYKEVDVPQSTIDQIQYIYDEISSLLSYIQNP